MSLKTRILVVGDGRSAIHEVAVLEAFRKLGHEVGSFYWRNYFNSSNPVSQLFLRAQNKYLVGPVIRRLNSELIIKAAQFDPKLIFIYRGTHIMPSTIVEMKRKLPHCVFFGYNNDDPFAEGHPFWLWRHFLKCAPLYDLMFAYRRHNICDYENIGVRKVELLMPWFIPEKDRPKLPAETITRKYDVVFVGHYEADDRLDYLKKIAENNFTFGLFGPDWASAPKLSWLQKYQPVLPLSGDLYRNKLLSSNIALCFLSKLNRDAYTRRCFEIPAMGVFMLCQYSEDLSRLFKDGVEAVFFHNPDDMIQKINYYISNPMLREEIAANGRKRVIQDGHDVISRMNYVLNNFTNIKQ